MEIVSRGPVEILQQEPDRSTTSRGAWFRMCWARSTGFPACTSASAGSRRSSIRLPARSSRVRVEVARTGLIHWDGNPVSDLRGRAAHGPAVRCRPGSGLDGVILRQEVPLPIRAAGAGAPARDGRRSIDRNPRPGCQPHDRSPRRDQAVRVQVCRRPARPGGPPRRAVRVPRAQRRGQDDHDQDDLRAAGPDRGHGPGRRFRRVQPAGTPTARAMSPISPISTTS